MPPDFATAFKKYYELESVAGIPNTNQELKDLLLKKLKLNPVDMEFLLGNFIRKHFGLWLKNPDIQDPSKQKEIAPEDLVNFAANVLKRSIKIIHNEALICSKDATSDLKGPLTICSQGSTRSGHYELVLPEIITNSANKQYSGTNIAATFNMARVTAATNQGNIAKAIITADRLASDHADNRVKERHTAIKQFFIRFLGNQVSSQEQINTDTENTTPLNSRVPHHALGASGPESVKSEIEKKFDELKAAPDLESKFKKDLEKHLTTQGKKTATDARQITENYFNYGSERIAPEVKKQIMADALVAIDLQKKLDEEDINASHRSSPRP
ncbi:MAG: hypothetical protein A2X78_01215 [Gammaproteobacteria bacterium GWE2_37_16]|nr:MAG: hypothetical protein A2X78_01215 [Gammaproteobacteria bacterium GWE2_37_16]